MRFVASYDNGLRLTLTDVPMQEFLKSPVWKLRMPGVKRRVERIEGQDLVFPSELPYLECERVLGSLAQVAGGNVEVESSSSLDEFKEREASLIQEKSHVGLLIKGHDSSIEPQVQEFARVVDGCMARPLRDKQVWDAFFMCSMRKSANFSVPGSGKTASTLGVFAYLRHLGKAKRLVVVCPKNAFGSWRDEWKSCFGDEIPCASLCFHDKEHAAMTTASKRKELAWNSKRYDLILVNYEAVINFEDELKDVVADDAMLVFDEVHKVKKIDGVRARGALKIAEDADYVVALTGTPVPNSYADIYNLLNILYPDDYGTFFGFSPHELIDPTPDDVERINALLQPFFCRTNKESLGVPPASPDIEVEVDASPTETQLFYQVRDLYKNDPLALIIRMLQLESDPSMLLEALQPEEFDGVVELDGSLTGPGLGSQDEGFRVAVDACKTTTKTLRCVEIASELLDQGKPLIVWCFFKKSMRNLQRMLRDRGYRVGVINGSVGQEERDELIAGFKDGEIQVLITNPHTLAESVSLHSVCHDAIYFEYGYNLVHLLQSKDRIHRLGLPEGQYTQYRFLQSYFPSASEDWSLDKKIYDRLAEKEEVMLEAIDGGVLEPGSTDREDIEAVFEGLFDMMQP